MAMQPLVTCKQEHQADTAQPQCLHSQRWTTACSLQGVGSAMAQQAQRLSKTCAHQHSQTHGRATKAPAHALTKLNVAGPPLSKTTATCRADPCRLTAPCTLIQLPCTPHSVSAVPSAWKRPHKLKHPCVHSPRIKTPCTAKRSPQLKPVLGSSTEGLPAQIKLRG